MLVLPYPAIDPVLIAIGPFAIRWYALAYIAGLIIGWRYCLALAKRPPAIAQPEDVDDFLVWATLGVVLGGRIGYVLFYGLVDLQPLAPGEHPPDYLHDPLEIFAIWHGGMSFHGGALGVIVALILFCRQRKIPFFAFADIIACAVPIGLFFGRLANFINGELWGRETDVPWAMVFPHDARQVPRHPSQLYEATLEGLVLFILLYVLQRFTPARLRPGLISGVFLLGYAVARGTCELFREPDKQLGFLFYGVTMGQLLSVPLLLLGIWLVLRARPVAARA